MSSAVAWGDVPTWVGASSVVLAVAVFVRDRRSADRAQVDALSLWAEVTHDRRLPGDPRVEKISIAFKIRNASTVPVWLHHVKWRVDTTWLTSSGGGYVHVSGVRPIPLFHQDVIQMAPNSEWSSDLDHDVAHIAPDNAVQLELIRGAVCLPDVALVVDNAGRRWRVRPGAGRRAQRVGWWVKRQEYEPQGWFRRG